MNKKRQDAIGTWHEAIAVDGSDAPRIVSLVPSITELVCDLGLSSFLVGRTGFCIHPRDSVRHIPKVGGTKDVNSEKIRRLAPTHLIVNVDENEKPCVEQLAQFIPHVIVTHPQTLEDNLNLFDLLGTIFNVAGSAQKLTRQFQQAMAELKSSLPSPLVPQRVLYCIWKDPWMTVSSDTYIANMLAQIGSQVVHTGDTRYPVFTWSDQLVQDIDLVLLSSEPYRFTEQHVDTLKQQCGKPVLLVDGEMISWYGSRSIAGIHYLKKLARGEL
jgi:ABC-type Fe3+-hydroxamate transport system substrate-binding protein